jgi:hypothetical protein
MSQTNNINVVPTPYIRPPVNVTNVQIRVINLALFNSVNVNATLFSGNDFIDSKTYLLEGTEYTDWGSDDSYIIDYVLTQLGLTQESGAAVQVSTS